MTLSTLIGSALAAALCLEFIWWLSAVSRERRRFHQDLAARNDAIDAHYQRNLEKARNLGIRTDDL